MDEAKLAELERRLEASERIVRELSDSQRLYRALFDDTEVAVTIRSVEDQSFIECNAAALRLYSAESVERLRGSRVTDLSPPTQADGTPSDEALRRHVARAIATGSERCEWNARRLDGTPFLADIRIAILELAGGRRVMQTMIEDVTERKAAQAALRVAEAGKRASEERFRSLVESARYAVLVLDLESKVLFANPAAAELTGYTQDELLAMSPSDLIVPEQRGRLRAAEDEVRSGTLGGNEWSVLRKDGGIVQVESQRSPVRDAQGRIIGVQTVVIDITARHRADRLREAARRELARAKEEAIAASRAKSAFLANMSHELRTPLNGVIGMVDLLATTRLDVRQKRYVDVARASARSLLSVINDVLDFSKIEAGKFEVERAEFSLREAVEGVVEMMELAAADKGIELRCLVDPALALQVTGDPGRLRQVLVNLVSNAVKFTPDGEVVVRADPAGRDERGLRVRFEVRDTGMGISEEAQSLLFQPFTQVDSSTSRSHGGTGLGLAICRELVMRMGGEIGLQSSVDVGSTFWFTLPFGPAAEGRERVGGTGDRAGHETPLVKPAAGEAPHPSPRPDAGGDARPRVLLVEDTPISAEVAGEILRRNGYDVDVAIDGQDAVKAAGRGRYEIVLMDCQLPGIDGYEAARRIRVLEGQGALEGRLPIVALTASATKEDVQRVRAAGMDGHLAKPVDAKRLLDSVARHLALRSAKAVESDERSRTAGTIVDLDRALARLDGNRELLSRMLAQFRQETSAGKRHLREGLDASDRAAVRRAAHRLRGQALSIDAELLAAALTDVELAAGREDWGACGSALVRVEREVDRVLDAVTHG